MELLQRYLRQIRRYLPFKDRDETINELQSLLLDQADQLIQEGMSEEDAIRQTIIDMGDPRDVAAKYNERGPIISKELEPIMILVMKITSITLPLVLLFADTIAFVTETAEFNTLDVLINLALMIPSALYSLVIAIGMVFIVFALIERYIQPKFSVEDKPFNPDLLPIIPKKVFKVSTLGSIITVMVTIFAVYLFNYQPGLIAVYYDGDRYPLLNESFDNLVLFLNIGWFASIVLHIFYLYKQRKNLTTKTIETILAIYGGVIVILLGSSDIFNDIIVEGYNLNIITRIVTIVLIFVGIATIIGSIVDYVKLHINVDELENISNKKA
jgi:hypothetical protein